MSINPEGIPDTPCISESKAFDSDIQGVSGIPSGFIDIDKKLGGLQNSDLIILAGRPSMGKTALATNIAYNASIVNYKKYGKALPYFL